MLRSLSVRDLLLIERLELDFAPGLNALTGETGAGKSILLDALGLALGRRGRGAQVRPGAEEGEAEAVFDLPDGHAAHAILAEAGLPGGDGELILRRRIGAGGRATAFVNDRRVAAETLSALGEALVEVHGQHDDRGLLNPRGHRALLDGWAGLGGPLAEVRAAWARRRDADAALAEARAAAEEAARDADWLRHAAEEMRTLAPEPGEDTALDTERRRMQAAERVRAEVTRAAQALGPDGAEGLMGDAARWLEGAAADGGEALEGRLDPPVAAIDRAMAELQDALAGVESALDALEADPLRLEAVEERLFAIRAAARKHGVLADELPELADALVERLEAIDAGEARIEALEVAAAEAASVYDRAADALSRAREDAAARLDAAVAEELPALKMERALFRTAVAEEAPGPDGVDRVEFTVATSPGATAGPIGRIASGGELSRFLLALKACLAAQGDARVMIFDEIDRGVGGATAAAVGARLAALAQGGQVLVVTHAPQVAARADRHFLIAKVVDDSGARTEVRALPVAEREDEIARMLAGETVTDAARQAARALLEV